VIKIRMIMKPMASRVDTSTPVWLQDLCLNSYVSEAMASDSRDFIEKFSFLLAKVSEPNITLEQSNLKVLEFRKLGAESHKTDVVGIRAFTVDPRTSSLDDILDAYGFEDLTGGRSLLKYKTKAERTAAVAKGLSKEELKALGYVPISDPSKSAAEIGNLNKAEKDRLQKAFVDAGS